VLDGIYEEDEEIRLKSAQILANFFTGSDVNTEVQKNSYNPDTLYILDSKN
jgi:hypothetical protein